MEDVFQKIIELSFAASLMALAIILLRLLLKKAPRWTICLLWSLVAIRLCIPFSFESNLSLVPDTSTLPQKVFYQTNFDSNNLTEPNEIPKNEEIPIKEQAPVKNPTTPDVKVNSLTIFSYLWISGCAGMLIYGTLSYAKTYRKIRTAVLHQDNIYYCDYISTPFVLGFIKPRIYLPSDITEENAQYVIAHEKAHIARRDYLTKPLAFLLLSFHWFNPLLWIAYILFSRDVELACDEKVIKGMNAESKKAYSFALVTCSEEKTFISACPLGFGEVSVKSRVKNVLSYKKPTVFIIILSFVLCLAIGFCFLTTPENNNPYNVKVISHTSENEKLKGEFITLKPAEGTANPYLEIKWSNTDKDSMIHFFDFDLYKKVDKQWENVKSHGDVYIAHSFVMEPNKSLTLRYDLWDVNINETGTYRFQTDFMQHGGLEYPSYDYSIEFEVRKIPEIKSDLVMVSPTFDPAYTHGEARLKCFATTISQVVDEDGEHLKEGSVLNVTVYNGTGRDLHTYAEDYQVSPSGAGQDFKRTPPDTKNRITIKTDEIKTISLDLSGATPLESGSYFFDVEFYTDTGYRYYSAIPFFNIRE